MLQNLQFLAKFQKFQLDNLVDFEKCCKTHIYLEKREPLSESVEEHRGKNKETNVGKTAPKMTATIDFAMQFEKLHESGMQVSNICGCLEFHPSCIPAFLRASSICVVRLPSRKKSGESS